MSICRRRQSIVRVFAVSLSLCWGNFQRSNQTLVRIIEIPSRAAYTAPSSSPFSCRQARFLLPESPPPTTLVKMVIHRWAFRNSTKDSSFSGFRRFLVSDREIPWCFDSPDPIHTVAEPAGQDASRQVLRPSRGLREAQGRVRGSHWICLLILLVSRFWAELVFAG